MNPYLISGVNAGFGGLLTLLFIHHFWIQPIWFILPLGFIISSAGGLEIGWSYQEIYSRLPSFPWSFLGRRIDFHII